MTIVELDVREDIASRNDPFQKIMAEVSKMQEKGKLVLHTPFIPKPLLKVMEGKGFSYNVEELTEQHFITTFAKGESLSS